MQTGITLEKFLIFSLAALLAFPASIFGEQTLRQMRREQKAPAKPKLAPDLEEILAQDDQQALTLGQMRQNRPEIKFHFNKKTLAIRFKNVTLPSEAVPAEEKQSFIVQVQSATPDIVMQEKLARLGGRISRKLDQSGLVVIEAPRTAIRQIAADSNIAYVSPDRLIGATLSGYVERASGRDDMLKLSGCDKINGTDMNVAVLDSGIWEGHHNLGDRLLTSVDFTGESITKTDPFGHGTHVASLAAGKSHVAKGAYEGLAPGAKVANLRVLDSLRQQRQPVQH